MNAKQLAQLVLYIVDQVEDLGGYTTTIRLVKFLYLIDLEHQRRFGRTLTALHWQYYLYGPYAFELPGIGKQLGFTLDHEDFETAKGYRGVLLSVHEPQSFPAGLSFGAETVVNGILQVWALEQTSDLLHYVYNTEPMKHARRGDNLDFSAVPRGTLYYGLHVPVEGKTVRRLRESLRSYALDDAEEFVHLSRVHDKALEEGLRALDADEGYPSSFADTRIEVDLDELHSTLPDGD